MSAGGRGRISRTMRVALPLVLMAGFYLLALVIVAGLASIIVVKAKTDVHIPGVVLAAAAFGIVTIIVGIVPRPRPFAEPGPRVTPEHQPRLFDEIRAVAEATDSPTPHDVYIVADVNAAVDHVGGWMGIGSRPVMMLGLPLIAVLTVSELRGVIAHEFGHYVGGETRLSSVIYRTREGIGRTIDTLERSEHGPTRAIRFPFIWYAEMYMRLTQAQSRQHELDADRTAAGIAGGTSMESALITIHVAGLIYETYLNSEVAVPVGAGFRPPLADGFSRFLQETRTPWALDEVVREPAPAESSERYDSHPALHVRLSALHEAPNRPAPDPDSSALELISDVPRLEGSLFDG